MENDRVEKFLEELADAKALLKEARQRAKTVRDRVDLDFAFQTVQRSEGVIRNLQASYRKAVQNGLSEPKGYQSALTEGGE